MASPRRKRTDPATETPTLHLTRFLPYRLSVLTNVVSHTVAKLYEKRFGITIPEWRIIAVLGGGETLSAGEIAQRTAMDKVQVSRAISRMLDSALILRESGDTDRRKALLTLTPKALDIYSEIVPLDPGRPAGHGTGAEAGRQGVRPPYAAGRRTKASIRPKPIIRLPLSRLNHVKAFAPFTTVPSRAPMAA